MRPKLRLARTGLLERYYEERLAEYAAAVQRRPDGDRDSSDSSGQVHSTCLVSASYRRPCPCLGFASAALRMIKPG